MANFLHAVLGANGGAYKVGIIGMSFALNGASAPVKANFGGMIAGVRRLESSSTPFFRVTPIGNYRLDDVFTQTTLAVRPTTDAPLVGALVTGVLTPDAPDTLADGEFDIAVYTLAGARVDTLDARVSIQLVTRA